MADAPKKMSGTQLYHIIILAVMGGVLAWALIATGVIHLP
jgi:hypothetical protein